MLFGSGTGDAPRLRADGSRLRSAGRASTPVDDFGFVDLETAIFGCSEAGNFSDGARDVEGRSAVATDQMMVIVSDAILIPGSRPGGLDSADHVLVDERTQAVVDGLARNRADDGADIVGEFVGSGVRAHRNRSQERKSLRSDMHAVLTENKGGVIRHTSREPKRLDFVKN